jgi:hypothetical protein
MQFVADTSCLILLQRLNWLDEFLSHAEDTFICPPRVMQEIKSDKKLLKWLKKGTVAVIAVNKSMSITGISETDSEIIALATQKGWSILSEDLRLRQKAEKLVIPAFNVAELIMLWYQHARIDQNACIARLNTLVAQAALSKIVYRELVEIIKL